MRTLRTRRANAIGPNGGSVAESTRTILFPRDFTVFTGGHFKVWHYYNHTLAHPKFDAAARFTKRSLWDETNPWLGTGARIVSERERFRADALFLGGLDWQRLPKRQRERAAFHEVLDHLDELFW